MPKALDTNVVVRLFVDDGSKEVPVARAVFEREVVEISLGVILECEWVLRSAYKFAPASICEAFIALLSLDNVTVPDEDVVHAAIEAHLAGVDFADAMHLHAVDKAEELLTFDDQFARLAEGLNSGIPVRIPTLIS